MIYFVFLVFVNKLIMFEYLVVLSFYFEIYDIKILFYFEYFLLINRIFYVCIIYMLKVYKKVWEIYVDIIILVFYLIE